MEGSGHAIIYHGIFPGRAEENHKMPQVQYPVSEPRFEHENPRRRSRNATHSTKMVRSILFHFGINY
jgi:hypothetical protein